MKIGRREFLAGLGISGLSGGKPGALPTPVVVTLTPSSGTVSDTATSGTVLCSVSVTMSDSSTFTGVLTEDGAFASISGSNLVLSRNLTGGDDGSYTIHVTATQNGGSAMSPFSLTVNPPTPPGSAFITSVNTSGATTRNDGGDTYIGMKITIGSQPLTVTDIGRWVIAGNSAVHNLGIFEIRPDGSGSGFQLFGTTVSVNTSGATPGAFLYASLASNVMLLPGNTYYVCSQEHSGGDSFYNSFTTVTTTADATINNAGQYVPGSNALSDYSGTPGSVAVPVNFKYNVGIPGGIVTASTANTTPFQPFGIDANSNSAVGFATPPSGRVLTGTVTVTVAWSRGWSNTNDPATYQWFVDGVPTSPVLQATDSSVFPPLPWTINTATIADGTHHLLCRVYDAQFQNPQHVLQFGIMVVVANSGFNNAAQMVPVAQWSTTKVAGPLPDFYHYDPSTPYPTHTAYPFSYTFVPPANNVSSPYHSNPALLRDASNWTAEILTGSKAGEYFYIPQFTTTASGGVLTNYIDSMNSTSTPASYQGVVVNNVIDGARMNNFISPLFTAIDTLIGDASWYFVEISGRVSKVTHDGTITTIVGGRRDTTRLTLFPDSNALSDAVEAIQTFVGNWPPDINFGGGNDLCLDPRNSNIMYCCAQVDNWIGMINISTQTVTVYAGVPGAPDSYNDGTANSVHGVGGISGSTLTFTSGGSSFAIGMTIGCDGVLAGTKITSGTGSGPFTVSPGGQSVAGGTTIYGGAASFAGPCSIIMDSSGTMYISDQNNNAIRKLPSSGVGSPGSVTTLCGGTVAPSLITNEWLGTTVYNVTSIVWTAGVNGGTGVVVMAAPTTVTGIGFTLLLNGATNTGGSGDPNSTGNFNTPAYVVTAFTDSQHFTVGFVPAAGSYPSLTIGTLSGSMTFTVLAQDNYSSPTAAAFASTWLCLPNAIRFTSTGNIVLAEEGTITARLINLNSSQGTINTISRITTSGAMPAPNAGAWMWIDCDSLGTCGPVDDVVLAPFNSGIGSAQQVWRASLAQDRTPSIGIASYQSFLPEGEQPLAEFAPGPIVGNGHYMWAFAFSRTEGRLVCSGTANAPPIFWRIAQPSDPAFSYNSAVANSGFNVLCTGTAGGKYPTQFTSVPGFPYDIRPSFWSIWGPCGLTYITNVSGHNTFADLNATYPSTTPGDSGDVALGTYIQSGMGGQVPRPEMTGNDLANFIYYIRRMTAAGSGANGGSIVQSPALVPDNMFPVILTLSAVRNSSTQITVTWTTDKATIGMPCTAAPLSFSAHGIYTVYSGLESSYGTSHSMACPCLAGVSPVHYTVVVKDMAGNFSYATDHTVT